MNKAKILLSNYAKFNFLNRRKAGFSSRGFCYDKLFKNDLSIKLNCKPLIVVRKFHFTTIRRAIPPLLFLILRPAAQVCMIILGRRFRRWWKALTKEQQSELIAQFISNRKKLMYITMSAVSLLLLYYYYHVETCPYTKRKRFITVTRYQYDQLVEIQHKMLMKQFEPFILPDHDYRVRYVKKVVKRILMSNLDLPAVKDYDWKVFLINLPIPNAMVLPNGYIFVFAGMLDQATNEDQLGIVLSHEISHAILGHGMEQTSWTQLVDSLMLILVAVIWTLLPGFGAVLTHVLSEYMAHIITHLPNSRKLEMEADDFGLQLAAKACIDPREVYAFWVCMMMQAKVQGEVDVPEFLRTHPNHGDRAVRLEPMIEQALKVRAGRNCPPLKAYDPRVLADAKKRMIERQLEMYRRVV